MSNVPFDKALEAEILRKRVENFVANGGKIKVLEIGVSAFDSTDSYTVMKQKIIDKLKAETNAP